MKQDSGQPMASPPHAADDDILQLVAARLRTLPESVRVSIGSGQYTREQLLQSVERGDDVGKQVVEIQLTYLRDLASGSIYGEG